MKANGRDEAWRIADRLFPTDYQKDDAASERAGYPIYETTSTDEKFAGFHISDLNTRLELNMGCETVTIWIEEDAGNPEVTIILKDGHKIVYEKNEKAVVRFVDNGNIKFYNVTVLDGKWTTSYRVEDIDSLKIQY